ncbi:MAG: hypothetical protein P8173_15900, partial [Gammaproteobacteria bacterium]
MASRLFLLMAIGVNSIASAPDRGIAIQHPRFHVLLGFLMEQITEGERADTWNIDRNGQDFL